MINLMRSPNTISCLIFKVESKLGIERIKVMTLEYRVIHLLTVFGAFALLFTGVGSFPGSPQTLLHIELGIASIVVLGGYGVYLLAIRQVRLFDGLRKPISDQIREAKAILVNYVASVSIPLNIRRGLARYNVLASYVTIMLAIGFGELAISGVSLMFLAPGAAMFDSMLGIHIFGVGLVALFFLFHFFAVLSGENRPLLRAVFTNGKVPLNWALDPMTKFLDKKH